jgi:DNA invertase Pin-like site-specific DNA recombinase
MIYGYTRVSTDKQTTDNQKLVILEYAQKHFDEKLKHIFEVVISSSKDKKLRLIDDVIEQLQAGDTLLVYALDRLGRSTIDTLQILETIKDKGIKLIIIKDNLIIDKTDTNPMNEMLLTMLSAFAQLERSYISERTKLGLQRARESGKTLGRKKGQIVKSIYDEHRDKIVELLALGLSIRKVQTYLGIGSAQSLTKYVNSRGLKP